MPCHSSHEESPGEIKPSLRGCALHKNHSKSKPLVPYMHLNFVTCDIFVQGQTFNVHFKTNTMKFPSLMPNNKVNF